MVGAKHVSTPMATSPKLTLHSGTRLQDPTEYRSTIGSLQYLAFTRPDLSFAVNRLSRYMHAPTSEHWNAVKRTLHYLAGTSDQGIMLRQGNSKALHAFSDADWAGDADDYISTNGYLVYLGHHQSHGPQRNKTPFFDHLQRQSIALLPMRPRNSSGLRLCYTSWGYHLTNLLPSIVTMWAPHIYVLILSFTQE